MITNARPRRLRTVNLPIHSARLHLLRTPLVRTADRDRAERSRFVWALDRSDTIAGDGPVRYVDTYTLTPLGILHALTGLTINAVP